MTYLVVFGSEAINLELVNSYGKIKHRSLDLGIKYSLEIDRAGKLLLAYHNTGPTPTISPLRLTL